MNLVSKAKFARMAGVSKPAITKALRPDKNGSARLETYAETGKIDADSAIAQAYLKNPSDQRLQAVKSGVPSGQPVKQSKAITNAITKVQDAQKKRLDVDRKLKEDQHLLLEWKICKQRGEYVSFESVNKMIMVFLDRWLSENERGFAAKFDEIERDLTTGNKERIKIKQEFVDWLRERAHIAKIAACDQLREIAKKQSQK